MADIDPYRGFLIVCCFCVIFAALGVAIRREYYSPYLSDPTGEKTKRLRRRVYAIQAVAWIVLGIAHWWK
jgi:hypothetical protein